MKPGIYLAHKPVGVTSFSLVHAFMGEVEAAGLTRKQLPVCHGGTLDPFAEGLLLLLAGPATHLMDGLHALPKTYEAEVVGGVETDTGDGTLVKVEVESQGLQLSGEPMTRVGVRVGVFGHEDLSKRILDQINLRLVPCSREPPLVPPVTIGPVQPGAPK